MVFVSSFQLQQSTGNQNIQHQLQQHQQNQQQIQSNLQLQHHQQSVCHLTIIKKICIFFCCC